MLKLVAILPPLQCQDDQQGLPAPAVTLCPSNPHSTDGFPKTDTKLVHNANSSRIGEVCQGKEGDDIRRCVEAATYNLTDAIAFTSLEGQVSVGQCKSSPESHFLWSYNLPEIFDEVRMGV